MKGFYLILVWHQDVPSEASVKDKTFFVLFLNLEMRQFYLALLICLPFLVKMMIKLLKLHAYSPYLFIGQTMSGNNV